MAKKKIRNSRWEKRAIIKHEANKNKSEGSIHPQVRRQIHEQNFQLRDRRLA